MINRPTQPITNSDVEIMHCCRIGRVERPGESESPVRLTVGKSFNNGELGNEHKGGWLDYSVCPNRW